MAIIYTHWYLYVLLDKGKPFYVGISRKIEQRYKLHCSLTDLCTWQYIYWIKKEGRLPEIKIINVLPHTFAAQQNEDSLIYYLVSIGNKLCNVDRNPNHNRIITCNPYPIEPKLPRKERNYWKPIIDKAMADFKDRVYNINQIQYEQYRRFKMGDTAVISQRITG